ERLAVHARQLALQPHLQILRRSRRPLLRGMEQARRSALAHHVHRTAPMGPRVLINGIWYKAWGPVSGRMLADNESGAGYPIDQLIREHLREYNDRALGHGLLTMPSSFNVFEGFYEFKSIDPFHFFAIRPEKDHLFSLSDFLDFATSADHRPDAIRSLMQLPNGVIYNFTPVGDIRELAFLHSDSSRFLIAGFTMIRHEEQLHWTMIGGPICNLADETRKLNIKPLELTNKPKAKTYIETDPTLERRAEPLAG